MTEVMVDGPLAQVRFDRYDLGAYQMFLRCKKLPESQLAYRWQDDSYTLSTPARFAPMLGLSNADKAGVRPAPGFDDSFERMYQAVRRAVRFGQTETVRVHVPYVPELTGMMLSNVRGKEERFMGEVAQQEAEYRKAMREVLPS